MESIAEVAYQSPSKLGEGSLWSSRLQRLLWVDILEPSLHLFDPITRNDEVIDLNGLNHFETEEKERNEERKKEKERFIGTVVERASGGLVVALQYGFAHVDLDNKTLTPLLKVHRDKAVRFNDGKCDPEGRFWAGTMAVNCEGTLGTLYRFDNDLSLHSILSPVGISNGIVWSSDNKTLFYIDSPTFQVVAFDYDQKTGNILLSSRRVIVDFKTSNQEGIPDGMTMDAQGFLWIAHWGGSRVTQWDPKQENCLLHTVKIPGATKITSCAFGGEDLSTLFITSSIDTTDLSLFPNAGSLFQVRVNGVKGTNSPLFRG